MSDGGVGVAGLALAIPGIIDLCIKYGNFLKEKVQSYRHMNEIVRLYDFVAALVAGEMSDLLLFFQSIHDKMPPGPREDVKQMFQVLRIKLETVIAALPADKPSKLEKLIFSFHVKKVIEKACKELEEWQGRFLRRAVTFLFFGGLYTSDSTARIAKQNRVIARIKRIRDAFSNQELETTLSKLHVEDFAVTTTFRQLEDSSIYVVESGRELVEYRRYDGGAPPKEINALRIVVRDFAARLHAADPLVMGLLGCNGFSSEPLDHRFALRFLYPTGKTNPRTLQQLLIDRVNVSQGTKHSRSDRVELARKLASAVLYLHSCNFVHKNIRPTNILIFDAIAPNGADPKTITYPYVIGDPYLVGFDDVRRADARSSMIRVEDWKRNIYLHPDRHRMASGDEFTMLHDIYSLGVVLLEIALWVSVSDLGAHGIGQNLWQSLEKGKERLLDPESLRQRYCNIAKSLIPRHMGNKYRDVVISCLEGLRDEEEGGLLKDQDGVIVGSAYISQIMSRLEEITM